MTLELRLAAVVQAIAADIKALKVNDGNLATLNTTNKTNLVNALNEVFALANGSAKQTDVTAAINSLKTELMGTGVPAAFDTFKEIADYINTDTTLGASLSTAVTKRVRFDAAQTLTLAEQTQACNNIGIGNPDTDFVAVFNLAMQ